MADKRSAHNRHINELSNQILDAMEGESVQDIALACASVIIHCIRDSPENIDIVVDFIKAGAAILRAVDESEGSA